MKCKVIITHQPTFLKSGKYGLTVTRLTAPSSGGALDVLSVKDDEALFNTLFGLGYSAPEIAGATNELANKGSKYTDERVIEESALETYGF